MQITEKRFNCIYFMRYSIITYNFILFASLFIMAEIRAKV